MDILVVDSYATGIYYLVPLPVCRGASNLQGRRGWEASRNCEYLYKSNLAEELTYQKTSNSKP